MNCSKLLACVAACCALTTAHGQTYNFSAVTSLLQSNLNLYASNVVAIVEQGDRGEIYHFESGNFTTATKKPIASATKWYSGFIVLRLAEAGYFQLDDRIGQYLPLFDEQYSNGYRKGDITIRQCFAMKSGLVETNADYEVDPFLTLAQSVDLIASNTPVVFAPGTQLAYEGDGMQVVGRICEVVTGKDWRTLADELLFQPLGMTNSDYNFLFLNPAIAGGARSTVDDYLKFLRMLMNNGETTAGTVLMSSRTVQAFFTNETRDLPEYYTPLPPSLLYPYAQRPDYGFGSWIQAENPTSNVVEEVSSPGKFGTWPWVDRKRSLRGIIFIYDLNGYAYTVYNNLRILAAIRDEIDAVGLPAPPPPADLTIDRTGDYLRLNWQGGTLQDSTNLTDWITLPWASSPFHERLSTMLGGGNFYRLSR